MKPAAPPIPELIRWLDQAIPACKTRLPENMDLRGAVALALDRCFSDIQFKVLMIKACVSLVEGSSPQQLSSLCFAVVVDGEQFRMLNHHPWLEQRTLEEWKSGESRNFLRMFPHEAGRKDAVSISELDECDARVNAHICYPMVDELQRFLQSLSHEQYLSMNTPQAQGEGGDRRL